MEILSTTCAGWDVQKKTVNACVVTHTPHGQPHTACRTSVTTTEALLKRSDWLREHGCPQSAFEATGVYGKPVFTLLEGRVALLVVHAQHSTAVPGRKTDTTDAEWIADLLHHGVLTASVIPSGPNGSGET
jgi:transposase